MSSYANEEVAWERLLDVQREAENRRLIEAGGPPTRFGVARWIASSAWGLAHALGLTPRWWVREVSMPAVERSFDEGEAAADVA